MNDFTSAMQPFIDAHVHLWQSEKLPPWLSDPALASIAITRSAENHAAAAGEGLHAAVYLETDVAPAARDEEAQRVVALVADTSNVLAGGVIGARGAPLYAA